MKYDTWRVTALIVIGFSGYLLATAIILFIYWVAGGDFERGKDLGGTVASSIVVGFLIAALFVTSAIKFFKPIKNQNNFDKQY